MSQNTSFFKMNVLVGFLLIICLNSKILFCREESDHKSDQMFDQTVLSVLYNNSIEFRKVIENLANLNLEIPARLKDSAEHNLKSYSVVDPTPRETMVADRALSVSFGLSSGFLPSTNETMDTFCDEYQRKQRREIIRVYIIRKYTSNFMCRLAFNLIATRVEKQNDYYCSSEERQQEFIRHAIELKSYKTELDEVRKLFKMRLINMQHTNLGYTKARAFCCSFWTFKSQTLNAIKSDDTTQFINDMFDKYFHLLTQYFCYTNSILGCSGYKPPMQVDDPEAENFSLAMNLIRATAKITSVLM